MAIIIPTANIEAAIAPPMTFQLLPFWSELMLIATLLRKVFDDVKAIEELNFSEWVNVLDEVKLKEEVNEFDPVNVLDDVNLFELINGPDEVKWFEGVKG